MKSMACQPDTRFVTTWREKKNRSAREITGIFPHRLIYSKTIPLKSPKEGSFHNKTIRINNKTDATKIMYFTMYISNNLTAIIYVYTLYE